jgi:hypothetical protein
MTPRHIPIPCPEDSVLTVQPLVARACAIVSDQRGRVLLCRNTSSDQWELPSSIICVGGSVEESVLRGVRKITALEVHIRRLVGVYSTQCDVSQEGAGEAYQELLACVACRVVCGRLSCGTDGGESKVAFLHSVASLPLHPWARQCVLDYRSRRLRALGR